MLWKNISTDEINTPPSSWIKNDSATGSIHLTVSWDVTSVSTTVLALFNSVVDITGNLVDVIVFCLDSNNPVAAYCASADVFSFASYQIPCLGCYLLWSRG